MRPSANAKPRASSVDSFIDGATLYAAGQQLPQLTLVRCKPQKPMVRAGFTLTAEIRRQLIAQAQQQQLSRSKLIRTLIHHFGGLSPAQQRRLIQQHPIR
ncbi:hypothetical protein [uncultured Ferrimonas sp.]|uniref:hypothetical protein n=1 Tax=uncultured Ferrimonas sp. TaxID=432640 RepID=UPI00262F48B0|nr:hypothetical protein [uncultured Ferrimonas sp.]